MTMINSNRLKTLFLPHGLIYTILGIAIICLTILTVVYASLWHKSTTSSNSYVVDNGIIGYPARLPNDGRYVQWTFLQMNDVYELLSLEGGRKGGLARVAYMRKLLKQENSHMYTICAGDLVSPSALGLSKINGTALHGKQMIATMNTLGVDFMIFGNHEFDIPENDLLARMNESTFAWISTNVFRRDSNQTFGSSISHKIITINTVRVLLIGLTIDGTSDYVRIINQSSLVNYVQEYLRSFPNTTYDVLVALTHLDMTTDIRIASKIPQIHLIMGGHEHDNYNYLRGTKYTPIYKADANAITVFIHRCAYNLDTKRFRIYSTLAQVTNEVPEEENTAAVAKFWFDLGIKGFQELGYEPNAVVSCLPIGVELDGKSASVRSDRTLLAAAICESMVQLTTAYNTTIGLSNGGAIRIDDVLREKITEYDILRTLPFSNTIVALSVPGAVLAQVLTTGVSLKGNGMFIDYTAVETLHGGKTWLLNGTDISKSGAYYNVATSAFVRDATELKNVDVTTLYETNITQTRTLLEYLKVQYPPC
ncbi:unnamed protein product [Rotaria socialis]|uniref:5'-nucleotidase n=1 Tax=Rotaria socialis TaxID=392032 RepID=A0A820F4K6_9BILA|nr:unnamed protein product [Rotaria socialis]CAF3599364.1 unnamed protein product [Rotaria socialis]CAF4258135.1 unnamed protein product [Rotaria socialis]CAF4543213.1 unnamed protein product [Rotaria socialis]